MENCDRELLIDPDSIPGSSQSNENVGNTVTQDSRTRERTTCFSGNKWKVFSACVDCLVQTSVGACVCVTLWFAFKSTPITAFHLHVALSVIGYQLLMAHGIICLRSGGWSLLSISHRRRVHWVLQLSGSILAIAGSAIMIQNKSTHFNSSHGKLALAALVFACLSLINGVASLYAVELRRFMPPKLAKISHVILGTAAFACSSATLATGYSKKSFKEWTSQEFANVMIGIVALYTALIVAAPCYQTVRKLAQTLKVKIC